MRILFCYQCCSTQAGPAYKPDDKCPNCGQGFLLASRVEAIVPDFSEYNRPGRGIGLGEIQRSLPWQVGGSDPDTAPYSREFMADLRAHKHFAHALTHIQKAAGKLAGVVDELDHGHMAPTLGPEKVADMLADIVISCLRMANTGTKFIFRPASPPMFPSPQEGEERLLNLEYAVLTRILSKNEVELVTDHTGRRFFMDKADFADRPYPGLRRLTFDELYPQPGDTP